MTLFTLGELTSAPASSIKLRTCSTCKRTFVPMYPGRGLHCYNEDCVRTRERARRAKSWARKRLGRKAVST